MKRIAFIILVFALYACTSNTQKKVFYKASKNKEVALLAITILDNSFYGQYEVRYGLSGKDSGEVRGQLYGDTLKGKYNYISYAGNKKWEPFVVLKEGENLKLGTGAATTYMNMPYYIPATLKFKDSSFLFKPISKTIAKELNLVVD